MTLKLNIYNKFLGLLIKKGNKNKAKIILVNTFFKLSKKFNSSVHDILLKIFLRLNVFVETKTIRVRRSRFIVPFSINLKRRLYLITKWIINTIKDNKKKSPLSEKIEEEIISILTDINSKAVKIKNLNNSQAIAYRSNIHYRW